MTTEAATTAWSVPNPDVTEMEAPVARLIQESRASVLGEPYSARAWGELGMVLDAHHLYAPAETCYRRAHALDPTDFRWPYFLAIVGTFVGTPAETIVQRFEAAAEIDPDYGPLYARMGDVLASASQLDKAQKVYQEALRHNARYAIVHRGIGQLLLAQGDPQGALRHLLETVKLRDGDRGTYASLAQAYRRLGRLDDAKAASTAASRLGARLHYEDGLRGEHVGNRAVSSRVLMDRARFWMSNGLYELAIKDLKTVLELLEHESIHRQLVDAYEQTGQNELAQQHRNAADRLRDGSD